LAWFTSRTFSSRYVSILAPTSTQRELKSSSMNLPNRDEFSLRTVFALPNAWQWRRQRGDAHAGSHGTANVIAGVSKQ
jgi:hypothetical protein